MPSSNTWVYSRWPGTLGIIQPYLVIASCFLVNLTVGSLYAVGNMIPYVVSFIRFKSHPKDLRLNTVTYVYACQAVGVGLAMLLGGSLDKLIGPRRVIWLGGTIMTAGAMLSYVTIRLNFWWFIFTYGFVTGIGIGTVYISPITCAIKWLPKWKGLVSGFVLSGIALGTLLYSVSQTGYINPKNISPIPISDDDPIERYFTDNDVLRKVPDFFLVLALSYVIITLVSSICISYPLEDQISESPSVNQRLEPHPRTLMESDTVPHHLNSLTLQQAMKTRNFYILTFLLTIGQAVSSFINPLYKSFGLQEIIANDHFMTAVVSVGAFFNLIGRIVWPLLADLTTYKTSLITQGSFISVFLLTFYATTRGGKPMYFIWVCMILFGIGGYVSLFPSAAVKSFGPKNMSVVYGVMASIALTSGSLLAGCISQVMVNIIEWYGTFFFIGGMSCVYFIVILFYQHKTYGPGRI